MTLGGGKGVLLVFSATDDSHEFPSRSLSETLPPNLPARLVNKSANGRSIEYVYARPTGTNDGLKCVLQFSSDLHSWANGDYIEIGTTALNSNVELVTNRIPVTGQSPLFIRWKMEHN